MKPQRVHPPVGKDKILETAEHLFIERGYRAVSIRDIAGACGVTNAALYYYFSSKEALFWEVLRRHFERLVEDLYAARASAPDGEPQAQLAAMLKTYAVWVLTKRASFFALRRDILAMAQDAADQEQRPFRKMADAITGPFDEVLRQAVESGVLRSFPAGASMGSVILGMLHGLIHTREEVDDAAEIAETYAHWIVELLWRGLAGEPPIARPAGED